jgi:uncharacterized protein (DUF2249 family)
MAQRHSETYRGFHILVENVSDDGRSVRLRRKLTRQLGERYAVNYEHQGPAWHLAFGAETAFADAIREAREAVDTLLGGWHPAYSSSHSEDAPARLASGR